MSDITAAGPRLKAMNDALERDRLRLTDAEREALHWFAHYGLPEHRAATLRGLLARMSGNAALSCVGQSPSTPNPHATPGECSVPTGCTETGGK
jgi:hypothetical protein